MPTSTQHRESHSTIFSYRAVPSARAGLLSDMDRQRVISQQTAGLVEVEQQLLGGRNAMASR